MNHPSPGRFRILLVEDSLEEGFLVRALVESEGLGEVVVAQDGVQGAELARDGTFDLVICDLNLPGKDGLEVIEESKSEYPTRPVIVTTGYSDPQVHARAQDRGADRVLTKPLDKGLFLEALWALLARDVRTDSESGRSCLAVGAFPGDVELGCGGVVAGMARHGFLGVILTLTSHLPEGCDLTGAAAQAGRHLGTRLMLGGLEKLDLGSVSDLVRDAIREYQPDTLLVPSAKDRSAARLLVHEAAMSAAPNVPHIYGYQSPTATLEYRPHLFASVEKVMERKVKALECFAAIGAANHLDPELARATARYWSRFSRHPEVEPLELLRSPPAPRPQSGRRDEAA